MKRNKRKSKAIIAEHAFKNLEESIKKEKMKEEMKKENRVDFYDTWKKGRDHENKNYVVEHMSGGPSILWTTIKHNGKVSGDAGHGGKVTIEFKSDYIDQNYGSGTFIIQPTGRESYEIELKGQWERNQFVEALKKIVEELS
jgi:hypothetical protein